MVSSELQVFKRLPDHILYGKVLLFPGYFVEGLDHGAFGKSATAGEIFNISDNNFIWDLRLVV
jgi:hypothetical protein